MKLTWTKQAGDVASCTFEPFTLKVSPKGDGRWNWQVFKGSANAMASGIAASLGAAKNAAEQFVKRST